MLGAAVALALSAACRDDEPPLTATSAGISHWLELGAPRSTAREPWAAPDRSLPLEGFATRRGQVAREQGELVLELSERAVLLHPRVDLRATSRLVLSLVSDSDTSLDIKLLTGQIRRPTETVSLRAGEPREVALVIIEAANDVGLDVQLGFLAQTPARVRLTDATLRAAIPGVWRESLEAEPGRAGDSGRRRLQDGSERRRGWALAPGQTRRVRFTPPAGAELAFATSFTSFGDPDARLELVAQAPEDPEPTVLASLSAGEARGAWRDGRVSLAGFAGREVELRVSLTAGDEWPAAIAELAWFVPRAAARTVLLITSDTHRADHVQGARRGAAVETPTFAQLTARGVQFTDAWASSHITMPSHAALMTGRTPLETGVDDNQTELVEAAPTLAEAFETAGWLTLGAVSVNLLNDDVSNIAQGFARFSEAKPRRRSAETIAALERWLPAAQGRDVFCWLHIFDVHGPYEPQRALVERYYPPGKDPFDASLPDPAAAGAVVPGYLEGLRDLVYLRALYSAQVLGQDNALARLFEPGSRFADLCRSVVAFTADHGEGFGEHDIWWAHKELYPEMLAVPPALTWPGSERAVRDDPVRQIDVGRTLLDLAGLESSAFPGRNLLASSADPPPRFALAAYARSAAVTDEDWLLIRHLEDHTRGAAETPVAAAPSSSTIRE